MIGRKGALASVCVLLACTHAEAARAMRPGVVVHLRDVVVTERGEDPGGDFCKDFELSGAQAMSFFERAQIIDARTYHADFDVLPCFVRGSARDSAGPVTWEIRAGGTGSVASAKNDLLLGCTGCDDLFSGNHR